MCNQSRVFIPIFIVGVFVLLLGGCDSNDPGTVQSTQPTVQFGDESIGVIPRDTTVAVSVTSQNLDEGEASVEVLYAEQASSVSREEIEGLPSPEEGNVFVLTFTPDDETVELPFNVSEVDITQGQKQARFALQSVQGADIGEPREATLSIGAEPIIDVKDRAREQGGGAVTATIQGIVIRSRGWETRIQDETGGIMIRQPSGDFHDDVQAGAIASGDEVLVTGTLTFFSGLTQINEPDNLQTYTRISRGNSLPDPFELTLDEITEDPEVYESRLVRVNGLEVTGNENDESDPGDTFEGSTTYIIEDGSGGGGSLDLEDNITLRIPNSGDTQVDGMEIPEGEFDFQGVLTQFNVFGNPTADVGYQVVVVEEDDIILE